MTADNPDFNEDHIPLAYFISFRCYGTWLHGDVRGSVDRFNNFYGDPFLPSDEKTQREKLQLLKQPPVELTASRRQAVEEAIRSTCQIRHWSLFAINVRTNHVHTVVTADRRPELVLNAFKANATSRMIETGVWQRGCKLWSRHGSTRYLWTDHNVAQAIDYVINGQGDELPNFD